MSRDKILRVRLTEQELEQVQQIAKKHQLPAATLVRDFVKRLIADER